MPPGDQQARVLGLAGAREALPGEMRTYTVREPGNHTTDPPRTVTVVVSAACPARKPDGSTCGCARGEPVEEVVHDSWTGIDYKISRWRNQCSHLDLHRDVHAEAQRGRLGETA